MDQMTRGARIRSARNALRKAEERLITCVSPENKDIFMLIHELCDALDRGEIPEGLEKVLCPGCGGESYLRSGSAGAMFCLNCGNWW
jgi:hypothetical protein